MHKMKLLAAAAIVIAGCAGAAAQSYGSGDPAWAHTTDPNSSPRMNRSHSVQMNHDDMRMQHGWRTPRAYDAYAAAPAWGWRSNYGAPRWERQWYRSGTRSGLYQAQSGGNGSPVSAGSMRGSTDRTPPASPFASGPYGGGERRG
jgi:hypothetical protein